MYKLEGRLEAGVTKRKKSFSAVCTAGISLPADFI
jgi:hypothetical protein